MVGAGYQLTEDNIVGLGPVSPVACNDDDAGKGINRRVEVWIRD